jgi:hypothetical protein
MRERLWIEQLLDARRRQREAELEAEWGDAREWLYAELDEMAQRIKVDPNYAEPSEEEQAKRMRELDEWFTEHYGSWH